MKNRLKILAVEDDPIHEERLIMILDKLNYELIEVLKSPNGVIAMVAAIKPDVILMDIDLGAEINGIEITKRINETFDIPTIFLTSFGDSETFKKAKEALPHAYLVKPYKEDELQRAIELSILKEQENKVPLKSTLHQKDHLFIRTENKLIKLSRSDVQLISAHDKYCYIYTSDQKIMVKERLKNIHALLPDDLFIQVHRSHIININSISSFSHDMSEVSVAKQKVSLGRSYKHNLLSRINTIG